MISVGLAFIVGEGVNLSFLSMASTRKSMASALYSSDVETYVTDFKLWFGISVVWHFFHLPVNCSNMVLIESCFDCMHVSLRQRAFRRRKGTESPTPFSNPLHAQPIYETQLFYLLLKPKE